MTPVGAPLGQSGARLWSGVAPQSKPWTHPGDEMHFLAWRDQSFAAGRSLRLNKSTSRPHPVHSRQ